MADKHGLIYLACPYTSADIAVRVERFRRANEAAGYLMAQGHFVFSPISHTHPIALACDLPGEFAFWHEYDRMMIARCSKLYVLMLDGWEESQGVRTELEIAAKFGIPITRLERSFGEEFARKRAAT